MSSPKSDNDLLAFNADAWNHQAEKGNPWTVPVTADEIASARQGQLALLLTNSTPVPADWLGNLRHRDVLCLAGGGGQQAPLMAAAGANVTSLDNSAAQLERDRQVAEREGLELKTIQGDMAQLDMLDDQSFDLIFNPCSIVFVPDPLAVWRECFRVLRPGGRLMSGSLEPAFFLFDDQRLQAGECVLRYRLPYSDTDQLPPDQLQKFRDEHEPLCFGHTLQTLLGGQMQAGFRLIGFFEDHFEPGPYAHFNDIMPPLFATLAEKPQ